MATAITGDREGRVRRLPDLRTLLRRHPAQLAAAAALVIAIALPVDGRSSGVASVALLVLGCGLALIRAAGSTARAITAVIVGVLPALVIVGVLHDLLGIAIPIRASRVLVAAVWLTTSAVAGLAVTRRLVGRRAVLDVWVRLAGAGMSTLYLAGALLQLLRPERGPTARLAWILGEEDNAQIVGVAREILTDGPRGAELAQQYGTAFGNLPLLLIRLLGGPHAADPSARLQAITVFTVSTILAILIIGLALGLLLALPHHVQRRQDAPAPLQSRWATHATELAFGGLGSAAAVLAALSLLVVLPMRTGFLTLVWGLALVLTSSALIALTPASADPKVRLLLVGALISVVALLLSSWPFIITAMLPAVALPLGWIHWKDLARFVRRHRAQAAGISAVALVVVLAATGWFVRWGPAAEVLSYGRDILLIDASWITADASVTRLSVVTVLVAALVAARSRTSAGRAPVLLALLGPPVGAGALYVGLRAAAELFTGGVLNYSGIKLLYVIIALGVALGLATLVSQAVSSGAAAMIATSVLLVAVHTTSPTVALHTEWWDRADLEGLTHAAAAIDAVRNSSDDLPIRCLPSLGTPVTDVTRWAAYYCARWMEDAFNEGRFAGRRFDFFEAEGPTFDELIETILREDQSEYLFAYRMTMGVGWFGWDGSGGSR